MADLYIDTPEALEQLCERVRPNGWFALDTEFIREKSYTPRLCLIQMATPTVVACIDPLVLDDLRPLLKLLYDPGLTKVLHAARQDMEIFFELCGEVPAPLFDSQVAAAVLGHGDQIGYGNLVQAELGVCLDKAHARTDWCQRPLDPEQLAYAADDVRYLCRIYQNQVEQLASRGRSEWVREDFEELTRSGLYANDPEEAWRRIKGAGRLKGGQLAILRALAAWREREARQTDKPRRWVAKDEVLLDLARHAPKALGQMLRIRGLEEGFAKRHGKRLLELIAEARQLPPEQWPQLREGVRLPVKLEAVVDALASLLRELCRQNEVTPASVAGRRDLEKLALGERDLPLLHGWRRAVAGEALLAFLQGELVLSVRQGRLEWVQAAINQ